MKQFNLPYVAGNEPSGLSAALEGGRPRPPGIALRRSFAAGRCLSPDSNLIIREIAPRRGALQKAERASWKRSASHSDAATARFPRRDAHRRLCVAVALYATLFSARRTATRLHPVDFHYFTRVGPIIRLRYIPFTHRIYPYVVPFLFIAFTIPHDVVKKTSLPEWRFLP